MPIYTNQGGVWKAAADIEVPVAGTFRQVKQGWAKVGSTWVKVYETAVPTTTTVAAASSSVIAPDTVQLTVNVKRADTNAAISDGTVTIEVSTDAGATWTPLNTTGGLTLTSGALTYLAETTIVSATQDVQYRAVYSGSGPYIASTSAGVTVNVRVLIGTLLRHMSAGVSVTTLPDIFAGVSQRDIYIYLLTDTSGNALAGQSVNITVTGIGLQTVTTDAYGLAYLNLNLPAGTYTINGSFDGAGDYTASTGTTLTLNAVLDYSTVNLNVTTLHPGGNTASYYTENVTLTATVTNGSAATAGAGRTVNFQFQSGASWTTVATVVTDASGVASYTYVTSLDNFTWRAQVVASSSNAAAVSLSNTVNVVDMPTTVTLTANRASGSIISDTTSTTFTATVYDRNNRLVTVAPVTFNYRVYGSAAGLYTGLGTTDSTSPFTWTTTQTESYAVIARVATATAGYATSNNSNSIIIYVTEYTVVQSANATRSFDSSGALRATNSTTQIYHGYFDSTYGDQRGAIWFAGFPWSRVNNALAVTSGSLGLSRTGSGGSSTNTTFYIGTHTSASVQSTYGAITGKVVRSQSVVLDWNQAALVSLNSTIRNAFRDGAKGIIIGPANSTSTTSYYGILDGGSSPSLYLTYYMDPTI